MKKVTIMLSTIAIMLSISLIGQNIDLSFTGDNNGQPISLDSVLIKNVNQGGEVMLYPPDLTLVLVLTGIQDELNKTNSAFNLSQNYPNPFNSHTSVQVHVPETKLVKLVLSNLLGQNLLTSSKVMNEGTHTFSFTPGKENCYFLTTSCEGHTQTIKMLCNSVGEGKSISLRHTGKMNYQPIMKSLEMLGELPFELGDELLMCAWSAVGESGMSKSPQMSQEYTMQFATNIPCPGAETVVWAEQTYNTIQIFGQCWFKENLNAGQMITSSQAQSNNDTIEKYCFGNDEYYCGLVGGLYKWNEMMQYSMQTAGQGICPDGWHVPDDLDWQILEGAVDSVFKIGNPVWGDNGWRGSDGGGNLKQTGTSFWEPPNTGATDAFGFKVLPAGYFVQNAFWGGGYKAYLWSSETAGKFYRNMDWNETNIRRGAGENVAAFSVRCVRN
jgi:uncharacterized protein (TIGR02145 family)